MQNYEKNNLYHRWANHRIHPVCLRGLLHEREKRKGRSCQTGGPNHVAAIRAFGFGGCLLWQRNNNLLRLLFSSCQNHKQ